MKVAPAQPDMHARHGAASTDGAGEPLRMWAGPPAPQPVTPPDAMQVPIADAGTAQLVVECDRFAMTGETASMTFRLARGLHLQRTLAGLAVAASLAVGAVAGSAPALAAGSGSAQVTVSATVLRHASIRVLSAPRTITISEADIARGFVDSPVSAKLEIRSNSPTGYRLTIESQAEFAKGTEVRGIGGVVTLSRFGGVLNVPSGGRGMQTMPVELSFRVLLSDGALPGDHPWPLQISVLSI